MEHKAQCALAYDEGGGFRFGIMTTNSSESFNRVFTRVRSLPVSRIVEFSFHKGNEYFVKRWELAQRNIAEQGCFGKAGAEHLKEAEELAKQHTAEPYGPRRRIFSVWGKGGTSLGGERYGERNYRVDLEKTRVQLQYPSDHACPLLSYDHGLQGSRVQL